MSARSLRIAILAHSTNPRGGVVHALEFGGRACRAGSRMLSCTPPIRAAGASSGAPQARPCRSPARPVGLDVRELVETRAADYVNHFEDPGRRRFDVFHAQDGISANVPGDVETARHDRELRSHRAPYRRLRRSGRPPRCSDVRSWPPIAIWSSAAMWRQQLAADFGTKATTVGNGVDRRRYHCNVDGSELALREKLGLGSGPVILAVGGVEERKNTLRLLEAFAGLLPRHPGAQLVIAGGASLLDHEGYRRRYALAKAELRLAAGGGRRDRRDAGCGDARALSAG